MVVPSKSSVREEGAMEEQWDHEPGGMKTGLHPAEDDVPGLSFRAIASFVFVKLNSSFSTFNFS